MVEHLLCEYLLKATLQQFPLRRFLPPFVFLRSLFIKNLARFTQVLQRIVNPQTPPRRTQRTAATSGAVRRKNLTRIRLLKNLLQKIQWHNAEQDKDLSG